MKVSVIVPNYNHACYLRQRLDSIYHQTYQNFEVILLDDASTDQSISILETYRSHPLTKCILFNKTNTGNTFIQWRKGMEYASGELVWIAESDDWAEVDFLERMVTAFQDDNVGLALCRSLFVDESGDHICKVPTIYQKPLSEKSGRRSGVVELATELLYRLSIVNASAILFRRNSLLLEKLPEDFMFCGDWWIVINVLANYDYHFINEKLNYYRINRSGVTFSKRNLYLERKRFKEYVAVSKSAYHILNQQPQFSNQKHRWLAEDWASLHNSFKLNPLYYLPPLPLVTSFYFYYYILKKGIKNLKLSIR